MQMYRVKLPGCVGSRKNPVELEQSAGYGICSHLRTSGQLYTAVYIPFDGVDQTLSRHQRGGELLGRGVAPRWCCRHDGPRRTDFTLGSVEQAEEHYRQALALAEALGMRPLQAHCHLGLGTLYVKTDRHEQARAELATAIDLYRAMEMTFWLSQAEAALAHIDGAKEPDRLIMVP